MAGRPPKATPRTMETPLESSDVPGPWLGQQGRQGGPASLGVPPWEGASSECVGCAGLVHEAHEGPQLCSQNPRPNPRPSGFVQVDRAGLKQPRPSGAITSASHTPRAGVGGENEEGAPAPWASPATPAAQGISGIEEQPACPGRAQLPLEASLPGVAACLDSRRCLKKPCRSRGLQCLLRCTPTQPGGAQRACGAGDPGRSPESQVPINGSSGSSPLVRQLWGCHEHPDLVSASHPRKPYYIPALPSSSKCHCHQGASSKPPKSLSTARPTQAGYRLPGLHTPPSKPLAPNRKPFKDHVSPLPAVSCVPRLCLPQPHIPSSYLRSSSAYEAPCTLSWASSSRMKPQRPSGPWPLTTSPGLQTPSFLPWPPGLCLGCALHLEQRPGCLPPHI